MHDQGLEPWTLWLRVICSTNWANRACPCVSIFNAERKGYDTTNFLLCQHFFSNFFKFFKKKLFCCWVRLVCSSNLRCWFKRIGCCFCSLFLLYFRSVFVIISLCYNINLCFTKVSEISNYSIVIWTFFLIAYIFCINSECKTC